VVNKGLDHVAPQFAGPLWLPGGHLQTIVPAVFGRRPGMSYRRERWETPDADFIDLDWIDAKQDDAPLLVVFHGLEGSSRSRYSQALAHQAGASGWSCVVVHFRGCSGEPNRAPRFYHSGDSNEIDWIMRRLHSKLRATPLHAVGISLGGNALLKWLAERGSEAAQLVRSAAAISAPVDLPSGGHALSSGFNLVYARMFLKSLKAKSLVKLQHYPGLFDRGTMLAARDLYQFDNVVTAPLHGYRDTDDYWRRAASKPLLGGITTPTLILNALNDPFLPAHALPTTAQVSTQVTLDFPATGGHVGFLANAAHGGGKWMPQRVMFFLNHGY